MAITKVFGPCVVVCRTWLRYVGITPHNQDFGIHEYLGIHGYSWKLMEWKSRISRKMNAETTDVPLSSLCPPRRWSGARVGVGMLRGT